MIRFFKKAVIGSNKGISIVLAVIIIIVLGLAGSIFAYLTASGSLVSRSNLTSAAAKYAAKSGVDITMYIFKTSGLAALTSTPPAAAGCPAAPVIPPGVSGKFGENIEYLYGNLGNYDDYAPSFCALIAEDSDTKLPCLYVISSNGFAGGTEREITTEAGINYGLNTNKKGISTIVCPGTETTIFVENELPNG